MGLLGVRLLGMLLAGVLLLSSCGEGDDVAEEAPAVAASEPSPTPPAFTLFPTPSPPPTPTEWDMRMVGLDYSKKELRRWERQVRDACALPRPELDRTFVNHFDRQLPRLDLYQFTDVYTWGFEKFCPDRSEALRRVIHELGQMISSYPQFAWEGLPELDE